MNVKQKPEIILQLDSKLPLDRVNLAINDSVTVLALRKGAAPPGEDASKYPDETYPGYRLVQASVPKEISDRAQGIVNSMHWLRPALLLNLDRLRFGDGCLNVEGNYVNYGSFAALRKFVETESQDTVDSMMRQIAGIAVNGVFMLSNQNIVIARRANSTNSGLWQTVPAGTVSIDQFLGSAMRKEGIEELSFDISAEGRAHWIGVVRGQLDEGVGGGSNPNFNALIESDWDLDRVRKGFNSEHDKAIEIGVDEIGSFLIGSAKGELRDRERLPLGLTGIGFASLLQAGRFLLGDAWYRDTSQDLRNHSIEVKEGNPFSD